MIKFEQANDRFQYNWETGVVIDRKTGKVAGRVEKNRNTSYLRMHVFGKQLRMHQVAWLLTHRCWPSGQIDHIDGDGLNNRISNLRDGTRSQNQRNQRPGKLNKSGFVGVSWHSATKKWHANIWIDGKRKFLGRFKRLKHAVAARLAAAAEHGYSR
jgi:hypothetical protein